MILLKQTELSEERYEKRGLGAKKSRKRAWATVNKSHGWYNTNLINLVLK